MTGMRNIRTYITGTLALMTALICVAGSATIKPSNMPQNQDSELAKQMATVEIKTMSAANSALSNGAIRGIDVSQYQGTINWPQVAQDNVKFVMARASIGTTQDTHFSYNAQGARQNGLDLGVYHYAKFTDRASMIQEANLLLGIIKNYDITYPVALDIEATRGMNRATLTALCNEFLDMVQSAGYTPILYSYTNFFRDYMNINEIRHDIWVANYMEQPSIPSSYKMWQHTSYGSVSGIGTRVDINIAFENLGIKGIRVNKGISDSIKQTLNDWYNVGLPMDGVDMAQMSSAVLTGLQSEIVRQMGAQDLAVTGQYSDVTLNYLSQVGFTPYETSGSMTYLLQVKLFYKGHYTESLTGSYDAHMVDAIRGFQRANDISETGQLDRETLFQLLA